MSGGGLFQRAEAVFHAVCDLGGDDREREIERLCAGDEVLKGVVRSLLAADGEPVGALDASPTIETDERIPERIGSFTIHGVLGSGGMGIVYEATQLSPNRRVALKVIHRRSAHEQIKRRFADEADILAKLNHPGIAAIYESGVAEDEGARIPYVAMELVRGESITRYARSQELGVEARVGLLRDVCRAVESAHDQGIVHRDLKPGNVLVDARGRVKVLDFGIAIDLGAEARTQLTQSGQLMGTLHAMAPEQVDSSRGAVDARTDVHALGLIGYELLTGSHPHDGRESSVYELIRSIRDDEISTLGSHSRALKGDLETIIAKALARDRDRRYADAGKLADDLDRYLSSRPIEARAPSTWYQFRKFSERNPVLVGAVVLVFVVLVVALGVVGNALREAREQRTLAEHDRGVKESVNTFLSEDLFAAANPDFGGDPGITMLDAMLQASEGLAARFEGAPEAEAEIRATMGEQFRLLNRYDLARENLERSVELSVEHRVDPRILVERRIMLTKLYSDLNELDLGLELGWTTMREFDETGIDDPEMQVDTRVSLASILYHMGRVEECAPLFEEAVRIGREQLPDTDSLENAQSSLAIVYTRLERYDEALELHKRSIERSIAIRGKEHPDTLVSLDNLGVFYIQIGRSDDALEILRDVLVIRERIFGHEHTKTYLTRFMIARALYRNGEFEAAEEIFLRDLDGFIALLGADHRYVSIMRNDIVRMYREWGREDEARRWESRELSS